MWLKFGRLDEMNNIIEKHKLSKLTQGEIKNLNSFAAIKKRKYLV